MSKIRVYISGQMTGIPMKNKPMFDIAEAWLKNNGYDPVNPTCKPGEILDRDVTEEEYLKFMRQDVYEILYNKGGVEEIWFLPHWFESRGSIFEYRVALFFGIKTKLIPKQIF